MVHRRPRHTNFEVVPLPEKLHSNLGSDGPARMAKTKHIFSISFDGSLRETRRMLLEHAGYEVTSSGALHEAIALSKQGGFDLVLMGHSVSREQKAEIIRALRELHDTPVLTLRSPGEARLPQVDYDLYPSDGPGSLLAVIEDIFAGRRPGTRTD